MSHVCSSLIYKPQSIFCIYDSIVSSRKYIYKKSLFAQELRVQHLNVLRSSLVLLSLSDLCLEYLVVSNPSVVFLEMSFCLLTVLFLTSCVFCIC